MRKSTIYVKFILAYLVFGVLGFFTITFLTSDWTFDHLASKKAEDLYNEANLIATQYASNYYSQDMTLQEVEAQLKAVDTFLDVQIWMTDASGMIMLDTRNARKGMEIENFDPASTGARQYQVGRYYNMFSQDMISVSAPITTNFRTRGYIIIHSSIGSIEKEKEELLNISYITLMVIFGMSLIILIIFTVSVYNPLKKITEAANEYASGNLKHRLKLSGRDEIGYLAATLDYMAYELDKSREYQRKFVANVSHDFRSPLTSIKGYVEAMKDGTIPYDMQEKYLDIVIFETERLRKLTSSLLTLNSYDSKETLLDITKFDMNQVIKKTVATFEGVCSKKKISFKLTFSEKEEYVMADVGKIQQVLYNLIDNAVKFSNANSVIQIRVTEQNGKIFVSVKDSGIGIPKESISRVFDRFYKSDLSRGKDKTGTGLGLSITKEIVQAHNENIDVISTEGAGTEFVFSMTKARE